ncbi:MAG: hypothetical protein EA358_00360 [Flavobacteriales bacterium]|nr:MAG: hypothetical protein EA358_00360 [Flavobacteriales bacterium]
MDAQNVHPQNTDPQNLNTQNPIQTTLKPNIRESETANENRESEQNAPTDNVGAPTRGAPTVTVGDIVGAFQSITTVEYIRGVKNLAWPPFNKKLWQRNYWENIVRNHSSYQRISKYIVDNPKNWNNDKFNGNINKNPL